MISFLIAASIVLLPVEADLPPELAQIVQPTDAALCGSYPADMCSIDQRRARGTLRDAWTATANAPEDRARIVEAITANTTPATGTDWAQAGRRYALAYATARQPAQVAEKKPGPFGEFLIGVGKAMEETTTVTTYCNKKGTYCRTSVH